MFVFPKRADSFGFHETALGRMKEVNVYKFFSVAMPTGHPCLSSPYRQLSLPMRGPIMIMAKTTQPPTIYAPV